MKIRITPEEIIRVIKTEPLTPGAFACSPYGAHALDDDECQVCAVGAILRAKLSKKKRAMQAHDFSDSIFSLMEKHPVEFSGEELASLGEIKRDFANAVKLAPLNAISQAYERLEYRGKRYSTTARGVRRVLASLVKKHITKPFTVDLNL